MVCSTSSSLLCLLAVAGVQAAATRQNASDDVTLMGKAITEAALRIPPEAMRASPQDGDFGILDGLIIDRHWRGAEHWGRHGKVVSIAHHSSKFVLVAEYSDFTAVSDLIYYKIHQDNFCVGCGRGTGWKNDEELAAHYEGLGDEYFATRADYNGVGHFLIDRGHQAPVGSFNSDDVEADITNLPTNLSPQSAKLNQLRWRFLETDIRTLALEHGKDNMGEIEVITGPLYELPDSFFWAQPSWEAWWRLLVEGGFQVSKSGKKKRSPIPWCAEEFEPGLYRDDLGKTAFLECQSPLYYRDVEKLDVDDLKEMLGKVGQKTSGSKNTLMNRLKKVDFRHYPNQLDIWFSAGKRTSTHLRVPLGYYKLLLVGKNSALGHQACPFIMDQVGNCILVSVQAFQEITHIDLRDSKYARAAGGLDGRVSRGDYTSEVHFDQCVPPGGLLGKNRHCADFHDVWHAEDITDEMMKKYWDQQPSD